MPGLWAEGKDGKFGIHSRKEQRYLSADVQHCVQAEVLKICIQFGVVWIDYAMQQAGTQDNMVELISHQPRSSTWKRAGGCNFCSDHASLAQALSLPCQELLAYKIRGLPA